MGRGNAKLWPDFCGPTYQALSKKIDAQRAVNLYAELVESGSGKNRYALIGSPGKTLYSTFGTGPIRGMRTFQTTAGEVSYIVSGAEVYQIAVDGTESLLAGTIANDGLPIQQAASEASFLIVSAGLGYYIDGTGVHQITDGDFPINPHGAGYLDGYFVVLSRGDYPTNDDRAYFSALNDSTSWDALDYFKVEVDLNRDVGMIISNRQLWIFGSQMTQAFYNSGDADTPIVPIGGGVIEVGCAAENSLATLDNTIFWLGSDKRGTGLVWRAQGFAPSRISTHAIETMISGYSTIDDAVSYAYQEGGHSFYQLSFPTAQATLVYDVNTEMWHERGYWNNQTSQYEADLGLHHMVRGNRHLVGSRVDGKVYVQSLLAYDDAGAALRRLRRTPHVTKLNQLLKHNSFELDMRTGDGLPTRTPQVSLRISPNGGETYGSERFRSLGDVGEYKKQVIWQRNGKMSDSVYEMVISDAVPVRIAAAYIDVG